MNKVFGTYFKEIKPSIERSINKKKRQRGYSKHNESYYYLDHFAPKVN